MTLISDTKRRLVEDDLLIPVTGDGDDEEGEHATQEAEGVSTEETTLEVPTDGSTKPADDFKVKFEELKAKYEKDISKVKSSLQSRETDLIKEKSILEKKLDDLLQSTMDDEDRKQYQHEKLQEDLENIRKERDELRIKLEQNSQFNTWKEYFGKAGISETELVTDSGIEGLFQSGMNALMTRIKTLEEEKKPMDATTKKQGKNPPEVVEPAKGKIPTVANLTEAIKHFASGDEEKFWRMAEIGNKQVLQVLSELSK